ncbi:MAG TPA: glycine zipper 2TM domain-containing protein [Rhodocyclaceae bacterium]
MKKHLTLLAVLAAVVLNAAAATPKETYDAAKKAADTQYTDDKALCADESTSKERLQCLRDAKAEYKKAISKAKADLAAGKAAAEPAAAKAAAPAAAAAKATEACATCGKVTAVKVDEKEGEGSALGVIAGGVAGAVLGHQVGGGTGKDLATIAGAAGGAYAGHKIEQKVKSTKVWTVNVKFDNGSEKSFRLEKDPGLAVGDAVKADGNNVTRR